MGSQNRSSPGFLNGVFDVVCFHKRHSAKFFLLAQVFLAILFNARLSCRICR